MEDLIYLCHRIPYPPNKGDKIRSYNLLKALVKHYHVHLGCFIDDPEDRRHVSHLETLCKSIHCRPLSRIEGLAKGATAFFRGIPITIPFYSSRSMQQWVDHTIATYDITRSLVFSSSMAQFLDKACYTRIKRTIDFVDVDSDKWRQYARSKKGLTKWVYQREYAKLRDYENHIAQAFDRSLLVSADEAELLKVQLPVPTREKVSFLLNGVDTEFFDPQAQAAIENTGSSPYIVFTGAMDYWANVDAVLWFSDWVWSEIRDHYPELRFLIVGGKPTEQVKQLATRPGIEVTGRVDDIRPFINGAALVVAPMRIARGIQNKVLEALSMAQPVVATSMAMEGIGKDDSLRLAIADDPQEFIKACLSSLKNDTHCKPVANRLWVQNHFSWESKLSALPQFIEG